MPRYIDADALSDSLRETYEILVSLTERMDERDKTIGKAQLVVFIEMIMRLKNAPTIDAEPVVRCKDCKWHGRPGCAIEIVDDSDRPGPEGFCCYAERKQDGGADDDA